MRKVFAKLLEDEMSQNKDIFLITADLGYGLWDSIRENYEDRAINVGSAEQLALGACVGLAMEGKFQCFILSHLSLSAARLSLSETT